MNKEIEVEILNGFLNIIIMDVARKYFFKLKEEQKKPPQLIENYLDKSIFLLQKYNKIEISKIKDTIYDLDNEEQKQINKLFNENEEDKEYEMLCKELNFAFVLIIDQDLQNKTLQLLQENIYELKVLIENEKPITKKHIDIDSVIKSSNKKKINKLHTVFSKSSSNQSSVSV